MLIISCWIKKVVCEKRQEEESETENMFKNVGIELHYFDKNI
jgi:deoxycytidylate deaminase